MSDDYRNAPMTVGDWMITLLVLGLPLVGIIMYLYWALSSTGNVNRKNFCIASILWLCIIMGITLAIAVVAILVSVLVSGT